MPARSAGPSPRPCVLTRVALALLIALTAAVTPGSPAAAETPLILRRHLPNGLTVLVEERPTSRAVSLALMVRAGSRDDGNQPGLLYFLSRAHLLGTERRPSRTALEGAIAATGGSLERGAGRDMTQFLVTVPAGELPTALDVLSDMVLSSRFDEAALEREKDVVAVEIARRLASPNEVAGDLVYASLFGDHPLGRPIVGTIESIRSITRDSLLEARDRYYRGQNLVLAVAGRVRAEEVAAEVERLFAGLPPGERNGLPPAPQPVTEPRTAVEHAGRQQAIVQVAVHGPAAGDPDRYAFSVVNDILGLVSGRIFTEVRSRRGLAYVAGSAYAEFQDTGVWLAYAGTDPEHVEQVVSLLLEEMRRVREEPLTASEVARAVEHAIGREIVASDSNNARTQRLARREVTGSTETDQSLIEGFRSVTPDDARRAAQTYLAPDRHVVAVVTP